MLSKRYLFEIFSAGGQNKAADFVWDPRSTNIPVSEHSPDVITMSNALDHLADSDFMFVNLGDVDRTGHVDVTGPGPSPIARDAVLVSTDQQVGRFVQALKDAGRWDTSVLIVLSDHGMDWSTPNGLMNLQPDLPPGLFAIQNGGVDDIFVTNAAAPDNPAKLAAARKLAPASPTGGGGSLPATGGGRWPLAAVVVLGLAVAARAGAVRRRTS